MTDSWEIDVFLIRYDIRAFKLEQRGLIAGGTGSRHRRHRPDTAPSTACTRPPAPPPLSHPSPPLATDTPPSPPLLPLTPLPDGGFPFIVTHPSLPLSVFLFFIDSPSLPDSLLDFFFPLYNQISLTLPRISAATPPDKFYLFLFLYYHQSFPFYNYMSLLASPDGVSPSQYRYSLPPIFKTQRCNHPIPTTLFCPSL